MSFSNSVTSNFQSRFSPFFLFCLLLLPAIGIVAQTPQAFKYQAVIRDSTGVLITNQTIGIRAAIVANSANDTVVYQEAHSPTTNEFGLVSLDIGSGAAMIGAFNTIDWGSGPYFIKIGMDETGGTTYLPLGEMELLSVPYALFAENVANDAVDDADADPTNELDAIFGTTSNITSNENGDYANDDFVFGSPQLDDDGNTDHDNRMFFDKSNGAFRAGKVSNANWNSDSLGASSFAAGNNTKATADFSVALGNSTIARGENSTAMGHATQAIGFRATAIGFLAEASGANSMATGRSTLAAGHQSTAMGHTTQATGDNSTSMGYNTQASSFAETALGHFNTNYTPNSTSSWDADDRLLVVGNGMDGTSRSDALVILKNGNVGIGMSTPSAQFEVSGMIKSSLGGYMFPDGSIQASAVVDTDTDTDDQTLSLSGTDLTISDGNTVGLATLMDNLGNHTAAQNIQLNGNWLSNDGGNEGISISNDGNVGIGASNMQGKLDVAGDVLTSGGLFFTEPQAANPVAGTEFAHFYLDSTSKDLRLEMFGGPWADVITFQRDGNIGVGTNSPSSLLHVHDDSRGIIKVSGSTGSTVHAQFIADRASTLRAAGLGITTNGALNWWVGTGYGSSDFIIDDDVSEVNGAFFLIDGGSGNVGIGERTPTQRLHVAGNICYTGSSASCSDLRYKKDIAILPNVLEKLEQINGVYYNWKVDEFPENEFSDERQIGVIAQELEQVYPELVITDANGYKTVDYPKLTAVLIEAVKSQQQQISDNESRITKLETLLHHLAGIY